MTYDEKLNLIVRGIIDAQKFADNPSSIKLYQNSDVGLWTIAKDDIIKILHKIEPEGVLKVKKLPKPPYTGNSFIQLEITNKFGEWSKQFMVSKPTQETRPTIEYKDIANHRIEFTLAREIVLDNFIQLHKTFLGTENDLVFDFLYQHPNQQFTKTDIERGISTKIRKPLYKIVENLGFKGDLKKAFFTVAKGYISFRNPVSKSDLEQLGISRIKLD